MMIQTRSGTDTTDRDVGFDYLRGFLIVIVLLQHSVAAYAVSDPVQAYLFSIKSTPIVDGSTWIGSDLFLTFSRSFAMALLFFVSGIFVWPALRKKGPRKFLISRAVRLGIPLVFYFAIIAPLSYYPAYSLTVVHPGLIDYVQGLFQSGIWPGGPGWFLWLLLFFDAIVAGSFLLRRYWITHLRALITRVVPSDPAILPLVLIVVSAAAYIPMMLIYGPDMWHAYGPFALDISRLPLYATYFLGGLGLGAFALRHDGGFSLDKLARLWPMWLALGFATYLLRFTVVEFLTEPLSYLYQVPPMGVLLIRAVSDVLACGIISFACIAIFRRFIVERNPVFDSISESSYGIFLLHYPAVIWIQFLLLPVALHPAAKAVTVFACSLVLCWIATLMLRRIKVLSRVI